MFSVRLRVPSISYSALVFLALLAFSEAGFSTSNLCNNVALVVKQANATATALNPIAKKASVELQSNCPKFEAALRACQESKDSTDYNCAESNNKGMSQFGSMMGSMADMAGMAMSQSCSKMADMMKIGQGALAGFRLQCLTARNDCSEKCTEALKLQQSIDKDLKTLMYGANAPVQVVAQHDSNSNLDDANKAVYDKQMEACQKQAGKDKGGLTPEEIEACHNQFKAKLTDDQSPKPAKTETQMNDFGNMIIAAQEELSKPTDPQSPGSLKRVCDATANEMTGKVGANMLSIMSSMQKNTACANDLQNLGGTGIDLKDCNLTGTCTPTNPTSDCQDPAFKNSIYCQAGTTNNGGGNTINGGGLNGGATSGGLNSSFADPGLGLDGKGALGSLNDGAGGTNSGYDPNDPNNPFNRMGDGGGSKSAGVPGGSGGGGLGIPGGGYNPRGAGGGRGPSGDGTSFGGSPSLATNGFGGGGSGTNKNDLDKYMPGGEKDPALNKKGVGPEGITAAGGQTLFEKVSKSYRNNRSTLIPE